MKKHFTKNNISEMVKNEKKLCYRVHYWNSSNAFSTSCKGSDSLSIKIISSASHNANYDNFRNLMIYSVLLCNQ
ncbi:hypothetical protein [Neobacillus vireti]|uniref:hypothetical protein n=1 Tax=Neobacillus vireti TaxID=220686 RepID=UPI003000979B